MPRRPDSPEPGRIAPGRHVRINGDVIADCVPPFTQGRPRRAVGMRILAERDVNVLQVMRRHTRMRQGPHMVRLGFHHTQPGHAKTTDFHGNSTGLVKQDLGIHASAQ